MQLEARWQKFHALHTSPKWLLLPCTRAFGSGFASEEARKPFAFSAGNGSPLPQVSFAVFVTHASWRPLRLRVVHFSHFGPQAKYKQLLLSLGNVRNYRLVASVLAGNTTPVDLATKVCMLLV